MNKIKFFIGILIAVIIVSALIGFYIINKDVISNSEENIVIEGSYSEGAVGYVYNFYKDGSLIEGDELVTYTGAYSATGKNEVEVKLIEKVEIVDIDTGLENVEKINVVYKAIIIDEDTLELEVQTQEGKNNFQITKIKN